MFFVKTLFVNSFEVIAIRKPEKAGETDKFQVLAEKTNEPTKLITRKKVDEENPLLMIRNRPIWNGPQTSRGIIF